MIDAIFATPIGWQDIVKTSRVEYTEVDGVQVETVVEEYTNEINPQLKECCWKRPPSLQMPSTRQYNGMMLVHAIIESEAVIATVLEESGGVCLAAQGAIIPAVWDYSPLDGYEPIYIETFPIDPLTELPVTEPVMELTNPAPEPILVSAATREIVVAMDVDALLEYMPDVVEYDADGEVVSTSRPTAISGLHQFSGRPWAI